MKSATFSPNVGSEPSTLFSLSSTSDCTHTPYTAAAQGRIVPPGFKAYALAEGKYDVLQIMIKQFF